MLNLKGNQTLVTVSFFYSSDSAFFTFTLNIFHDADFSTTLVNPVKLDQVLYFRALVVTSSAMPNLDLFILSCHSSKQNDPDSNDGKVLFIQNG